MGARGLRVVTCVFLTVMILGSSAVIAYAGIAYSNWRDYGPVLNINYQNRASVLTYTGTAAAYTYVKTKSGSKVPAGYLGTYCRLYKNGVLILESEKWIYNTSSDSIMVNYVSTSSVVGSNYYSKGISAAYNGNGYNTVATYQSPSQTG